MANILLIVDGVVLTDTVNVVEKYQAALDKMIQRQAETREFVESQKQRISELMADVNEQLNAALDGLKSDLDDFLSDVESLLNNAPPNQNIDAALQRLTDMRSAIQQRDAEVEAALNPPQPSTEEEPS